MGHPKTNLTLVIDSQSFPTLYILLSTSKRVSQHRLKLAQARQRKLAPSTSTSTAAPQPPHPDQQETQQMDMSPIVRCMFGPDPSIGGTDKAPKFLEKKMESEDSLLMAKTRRLDSFAESAPACTVVEDAAALADPDVTNAKGSIGEAEIGEGGPEDHENDEKDSEHDPLTPKDLSSVFDQQAIRLEIFLVPFVRTPAFSTSHPEILHHGIVDLGFISCLVQTFGRITG